MRKRLWINDANPYVTRMSVGLQQDLISTHTYTLSHPVLSSSIVTNIVNPLNDVAFLRTAKVRTTLKEWMSDGGVAKTEFESWEELLDHLAIRSGKQIKHCT